MPRQVFPDEVESKLIDIWADYQLNKSGIMKKRKTKEKEIAEELTLYARSLGLQITYDQTMIHNKIDNLKSKAREMYKKYKKATSTGSAAPDGEDSIDFEEASRSWSNFKIWHQSFKDVPGLGPLTSISSVSVSNTRSGVLPTAAVVPEAASNVLVDVQHMGRPNSESSSNGTPASAPTTPRTAAAFPRTQRPPMQTGNDSDDDIFASHKATTEKGGEDHNMPASHQPQTPVALTYQPGHHAQKRAASDDSDVLETSSKATDHQKKKKRTSTPPSSALEDVAMKMVGKLTEAQASLQADQQQFMATLMQNQQTFTAGVLQNQMVFLKQLFDNDK